MQTKVNVSKRRVGLAAATLLLGGAIGFASSSAVATSPASAADFGSSIPSGYLALQLRTDSSGDVSGRVLQYSESGDSPAALIDTQTFSVERCAVTTDGRLLRFDSSSGKVGLYNNGLGTKTKGTCSPAEGRTAAGETFTVSLGSKFGPSYSIDSSEFDIEGKFSASLLWTAVNGSTPVLVGTGSAVLDSSSDNGPDAGTGDNTIVTIGSKGVTGDNYTSLTLSTAEGEFALDGGGDGTYPVPNSIGTNDSVLFLSSSVFGYTVDCGEIIEATTADLAASDSAGVDSRVSELDFVRLANKDQEDCAPIGVTVSASDTPQLDGAYFDHSTTSASNVVQNVRARVKIVWTVQIAGKSQTQIDEELSREVLFAVDGQPVPVSNCRHVPEAVAANPLDPTSTDVIEHPDDTPWCLMSDSRVVSGNTIIQTQYYSGNGDPRFW